MLDYARWKYVLVSLVTVVALLFAAPNFFGEDLALQVARKDRADFDAAGEKGVEDFLRTKQVSFTRAYLDGGRLMIRFPGVAEQLKARDAVNESLAATYVSALTSASRAPEFFRMLGLRPMPLGLDLRGGLYLLYQVDVKGAVTQLLGSYEQDFRRTLTAQKLAFNDVVPVALNGPDVNALRISFPEGADL
jgi:preprotein translocase subunit SecD